jgi:hypothetical protein
MYKISLLAISLFFIVTFNNCREVYIKSKPTITNNYNWKIIEDVGYEGGELAYFVMGPDIKIRIDNTAHYHDNIFTITLIVTATREGIYKFNPSKVYIKYQNNKVLQAKAIDFSRRIRDLRYLRSAEPLNEYISIGDYSCFYLFFDITPPSINEKYVLLIEGLKNGNDTVSIPDIFYGE